MTWLRKLLMKSDFLAIIEMMVGDDAHSCDPFVDKVVDCRVFCVSHEFLLVTEVFPN